jgi:hypothetical protein
MKAFQYRECRSVGRTQGPTDHSQRTEQKDLHFHRCHRVEVRGTAPENIVLMSVAVPHAKGLYHPAPTHAGKKNEVLPCATRGAKAEKAQ